MNNQPSLSKFIKLLLYTLTQWLGQEKANRDAIAKTTVRVSLKTKRLLKKKHGFDTTDQVLRYYLPYDVSDKPVFHSTKEVRIMLSHRKP